MDGEQITRTIPVAGCSLTDEDIESACDVLRSRNVTMGRKCRELEIAFADYVGRKHAIFVNSGSSANLLAFFAIQPDIKGREVIVPALTWSTTIFPIAQAGAIPVLVDCDPETLQARDDLVADAITDQTAAICAVHVLGGVAPLGYLPSYCKHRGIWLVEDTCESLGAQLCGRPAGAAGDIATYSFYFSHQMNTIEGGMVVTNDDAMADRLRAMRSNGWTRDMTTGREIEAANPTIDPRFLFATTGFNMRPTEVSAALGLAQLPRLDGMNAARRSIAERLAHAARRAGLAIMHFPADVTPAPFGVPLICKDVHSRNRLGTYLEAHGISTRPIIAGNIARHPCMKSIPHRIHGTLSASDRAMDCGLYIGAYPSMTDGDVGYMARVLERFAG